MMLVQSWIGIFIQVVRFRLSRKAPATIRRGESQYESFTGGCNKIRAGRRALARCITEKRLCLHSCSADTEGKNNLVRAG
jgi:hypothetical protein